MAKQIVDLTNLDGAGQIGGTFFNNVEFGAGTGVIDPFVRIQNNGNEQGYNSSAAWLPNASNPQFNETGDYNSQFNKALPLTDIPIVYIYNPATLSFDAYRELRLDINEVSQQGNQYLSLDALQIYQSNSNQLANFTGSPTTTGTFTDVGNITGQGSLRYNMDAGDAGNLVQMNYNLQPGSGVGDISVFIPDSAFNSQQYVYVYSAFGFEPTDVAGNKIWGSSDGFEEWSVGVSGPIAASDLTGSKFFDANGDGDFDAGIDQAWSISNGFTTPVQIYLDQNQDKTLDWTDSNTNNQWDPGEGERWVFTDANGNYVFTDLAAGLGANSTFHVREVVPTTYVQTGPIDGTYATGVTGENATVSDFTINVQLNTAGVTYNLPAFGNKLGGPAAGDLNIEKYVFDPNFTGDEGAGTGWRDADNPTGPLLLNDGNGVEFKFVVSNSGAATATNVELSDSDFDLNDATLAKDGITIPSIAAGQSYTFSLNGTTWQMGQHTNTGKITYLANGQSVEDTDDANYFGASPSIDIEKYVWDGDSWEDADSPTGPFLVSGSEVKFRYEVTNTGNVALTDINVTDDKLGDINATNATLAAGASIVYDDIPGTWAAGQQTNTGTAATTYAGQSVNDTDDANYFGANPSIDIEKYVWDGDSWEDADSPTGPFLVSGSEVKFRYEVTNTGNVALTDINVTDDKLGDINATNATLAAGASIVYDDIPGTWAAGQQTNTGTAATTYAGQSVNDTDDANYFGANPSIDIEKYVWDGDSWEDADSPTGPFLVSGSEVKFRYEVTNTGNVALTDINVTDDKLGDINATNATLAAGASIVYDNIPGTWAAGQQTNTGTAATTYAGQSVNDTDDANYFGANPSIDIEKYVWDGDSWEDADSPTGPFLVSGSEVKFRYEVTNTGNVALTDINVTDDKLGDINATNATLAAGASIVYDDIPGTWAAGQQTNTGTAATTYAGQSVNDTDDANYFGANPSIDIEKYVWDGDSWEDADSPTGPFLVSGSEVKFRYEVTNTGNVALTDINVTDDKLGDINATNATLAAGASIVYDDIPGTWAAGQQTNTGTAATTYAGQSVNDTDDANYFGANPSIDIEKYVWDGDSWEDADSPTGPFLVSGSEVKFRYEVTNTGNVALTDINVTDDKLGDINATNATLAAGASIVYDNIPGTWAAGQQTNTGTAATTYAGQSVNDTDDANYFGANPSIDVEKYVSVDNGVTWHDADSPTGPTLVSTSGINPQFKFVVVNTGNVALSNVTLTDDKFNIDTTDKTINVGSLAVGDGLEGGTDTYEFIYTGASWAPGQHVNEATANGEYSGTPVSDSDLAHYFGTMPAMVTNSSLCDFGENFNLIFTPDFKNGAGNFKLSDSNPGQYYYNMFDHGTAGETRSYSFEIPEQFVAQGAVPIHIYDQTDLVTHDGQVCIEPIREVDNYKLSEVAITDKDGDGINEYTFDATFTDTGFLYLNMHLDFGLEKQTGWIKGEGGNIADGEDALDNPNLAGTQPNILEKTEFNFSALINGSQVTGSADSIFNDNIFKNIKGLGGLFQADDSSTSDLDEIALAGQHLIIKSKGSVVGDAYTDADGWYFSQFMATGKQAAYDVYWDRNNNNKVDAGEAFKSTQMGGAAGKWAEVDFTAVDVVGYNPPADVLINSYTTLL